MIAAIGNHGIAVAQQRPEDAALRLEHAVAHPDPPARREDERKHRRRRCRDRQGGGVPERAADRHAVFFCILL